MSEVGFCYGDTPVLKIQNTKSCSIVTGSCILYFEYFRELRSKLLVVLCIEAISYANKMPISQQRNLQYQNKHFFSTIWWIIMHLNKICGEAWSFYKWTITCNLTNTCTLKLLLCTLNWASLDDYFFTWMNILINDLNSVPYTSYNCVQKLRNFLREDPIKFLTDQDEK